MLDHTTLSASQKHLTYSSEDSLRDTEKTPTVVSDLSASVGNLRKNPLSLQETAQNSLEIASSIELAKIFETRYSWRGKEATRFILFIGQLQLLEQGYSFRERHATLHLRQKHPLL